MSLNLYGNIRTTTLIIIHEELSKGRSEKLGADH